MENQAANRRLPLNTELLEYSWQLGNIDKPTGGRRFRSGADSRAGRLFPLLRASELAARAVKDVTFGEYDGKRYGPIFIRKSKTDQEEGRI